MARPVLSIVRQPAYLVALFGAATGHGVMILAMTATPLAMIHHRHDLSDAALVIHFTCWACSCPRSSPAR
jgi:hypothetical protein